jgi:hypothetical protein
VTVVEHLDRAFSVLLIGKRSGGDVDRENGYPEFVKLLYLVPYCKLKHARPISSFH